MYLRKGKVTNSCRLLVMLELEATQDGVEK
jgi:hypothetical protein